MTTPIVFILFLGFGGVLELVAGLGLLLDPAGAATVLLGASVDEPGMAIGRIGGAGLLALGIACWLARLTPTAPASVGVAWACLAYNSTTSLILASVCWSSDGAPLPAVGASLLHGLLAGGLLVALLIRQ